MGSVDLFSLSPASLLLESLPASTGGSCPHMDLPENPALGVGTLCVNVNLKMGNYGGIKIGRNRGEKLPLEWP
jgi:hypothetical protein